MFKIEWQEWKGRNRKVIVLMNEEGKYPFSINYFLAKSIVNHMDAIKEFIKDHEEFMRERKNLSDNMEL